LGGHHEARSDDVTRTHVRIPDSKSDIARGAEKRQGPGSRAETIQEIQHLIGRLSS
jgi:hypothetical protein